MDYVSREAMMLYAVFATLILGIINIYISISTNKRTVFVNAITSERVKWMGDLKELLSEYLSLTTYYDQKPTLEGELLAAYLERLIYLQNRIKLHLNYIDNKDEEINNLIGKINIKMFGLYNVKDSLQMISKERFENIPSEQMNEYMSNVYKNKEDLEAVITSLKNNDHSTLISEFNKVIEEINKDFVKKYGYEGKQELKEYTNQLVELSRRYLKIEWEKVKREAEKGKLNKKKKDKWFKRIWVWINENI